MKLSRRRFLGAAAGAATLQRVAPRIAQAYPSRPLHWFIGAAAGSSSDVVARLIGPRLSGTARPARHHRRTARRRRQYRHPGGRQCAGGRLHAALCHQRASHQRNALRQTSASISFRDNRAGCEHRPRAFCHGGEPVGRRKNRSRVDRLCQSQSRQAHPGVERQRHSEPCRRRNCSR